MPSIPLKRLIPTKGLHLDREPLLRSLSDLRRVTMEMKTVSETKELSRDVVTPHFCRLMQACCEAQEHFGTPEYWKRVRKACPFAQALPDAIVEELVMRLVRARIMYKSRQRQFRYFETDSLASKVEEFRRVLLRQAPETIPKEIKQDDAEMWAAEKKRRRARERVQKRATARGTRPADYPKGLRPINDFDGTGPKINWLGEYGQEIYRVLKKEQPDRDNFSMEEVAVRAGINCTMPPMEGKENAKENVREGAKEGKKKGEKKGAIEMKLPVRAKATK